MICRSGSYIFHSWWFPRSAGLLPAAARNMPSRRCLNSAGELSKNLGFLMDFLQQFFQGMEMMEMNKKGNQDCRLIIPGWWFGTFFMFPYIRNDHPNWLIFFRGVETTKQILNVPWEFDEKCLTSDDRHARNMQRTSMRQPSGRQWEKFSDLFFGRWAHGPQSVCFTIAAWWPSGNLT